MILSGIQRLIIVFKNKAVVPPGLKPGAPKSIRAKSHDAVIARLPELVEGRRGNLVSLSKGEIASLPLVAPTG